MPRGGTGDSRRTGSPVGDHPVDPAVLRGDRFVPGRVGAVGLAPRVIEEILETLGELNRGGLPIILVEQKAPLVLKLARRAYLLSLGTIAAEIDPRQVTSHDELARFYLG